MSPQTGRRVHLAMLTLWVVAGGPLSWFLRASVPWVVFMSLYAIWVGHWSGFSAERPSEVVSE